VRFLFDHDVPDDMAYSLEALGHEVVKLREIAPATLPDESVLRLAADRDMVLLTCNRDDFLLAASQIGHSGIIMLIRRRSRALERASLLRLLDKAGERGIRNGINFA
jgi:predicted nuclease of predicted toxin-antitoxin system